MKVEMAVVRKHDRETRALKPFFVDERWAGRIEKASKGKIKRTGTPPVKRGRPRRKRDADEA